MKLTTILSTTALAVLLGISTPVFAQDESHPQEEKRAVPDAKQDKQEDKQVDKDKQIDKEKAEKQADKDKARKLRRINPSLVRMRNRISGPMPSKAGAFLRTVSGPILGGRTPSPLGIRLSWRELRVSSMAAIGS